MKKLLIAAALAALSFHGAATAKATYCQELSGLARAVMQARQLGLSLEELLESNELAGSSADELTRKLILSAYTHPNYVQSVQASRKTPELVYLGLAFRHLGQR